MSARGTRNEKIGLRTFLLLISMPDLAVALFSRKQSKKGLLSIILITLLVSFSPISLAANPGHPASSISAGTFESGNYTFPDSLAVANQLNVNGSVWQPVYPSDDGLVLYLPFSEGTGTKAYDWSGYGNDGTLYNGSAVCSGGDCPTWSSGKYGNALSFDGSNDYVDCGDDNSLNITDAITIEAWVKLNSLNAEGQIVSKRDWSGKKGYEVTFYTTPDLRFRLGNGTTWTQSILNINSDDYIGSWRHIVMTYDGATMKTFIDGILKRSQPGPSSIATTSNNLLVGKASDANWYINGTIDEVRIYNRSLSYDEIRTHYLRGAFARGVIAADKFRIINTTAGQIFLVNNTAVDVFGKRITELAAPTASSDAATKAYVDNQVSGATAASPWTNNSYQVHLKAGYPSYVNITDILFINQTSGRVGVGTAGPEKKLHVSSGNAIFDNNFYIYWKNTSGGAQRVLGIANTDALLIGKTSGVSQIMIGPTTVNVPIIFNSIGGEAMRISSGNLGIGTTTPTSKLTVSGNMSVSGNVALGGNLNLPGSLTNYFGSACPSGQYITDIADDGTFTCSTPTPSSGGGWTDDGTTVRLTTSTDNVNATTLFVDNTNGRVGIGTTAPNYKLHIPSGNVYFGDILYVGNQMAVNNGVVNFGNTINYPVRIARSTDDMVLYTNNEDRLHITTTGNLGIGTTTPSEKLEVAGNLSGTVFYDRDNKAYYVNPAGNSKLSGLALASGATVNEFSTDTTLSGNSNTAVPTEQAVKTYVDNQVSGATAASPWTNNSQQVYVKAGYPDYINASNVLFVNGTSGNVGIGTTSPGAKLTILPPDQGGIVVREADDGNDAVKIYAGVTAGKIALNYNGATKILLDASSADSYFNNGNVGIGTTSPQRLLDVQKSTSATNSKIEVAQIGARSTGDMADGFGPALLFSIGDNAFGPLDVANIRAVRDGADNSARLGFGVRDAGTFREDVMVIDSNGNVGIGTTSPGAKLHVYSNDTTKTMRLEGGPGFNARLLEGFVNGDERFYFDVNGNLWFSASSGSVGVHNVGTAPLYLGVNSQNSVAILENGNVGMGTTSPSEKLEVAGNVSGTVFYDRDNKAYYVNPAGNSKLSGLALANGATVNEFSTDTTLSGNSNTAVPTEQAVKTYVDNQVTGATAASPWTNNSEQVYVKTGYPNYVNITDILFVNQTSGRVGVGTTSPNNQLQIGSVGGYNGNQLAGGDGTNYFALNAANGGTTFYTNGVLRLAPGSSEKVRIDTNGNVGIGTAGPSEELEVWANSGDARIQLNYNSTDYVQLGYDTTGSYIYERNANNPFRIYTGGQERVRILSNGNVGIGTTGPGTSVPSGWNNNANSKLLEIASGGAGYDAGLFLTRSDDATVGFDLWLEENGGDAYIDSRYSGGDIRFRTQTSGTPVNAMIIKNTGNLGIGTTSPSEKLEVAGNVSGTVFYDHDNKAYYVNPAGNSKLSGLALANGATVNEFSTDTTLSGNSNTAVPTEQAVKTYVDNQVTGATAASPWTNNSQQVYVKAGYPDYINASNVLFVNGTSGNVGIGTTGPEEKLHISGGNILLDNGQILKWKDAAGSVTNTLWLNSGNDLILNTQDQLQLQYQGSPKVTMLNNGNVGIGTASPGAQLEIRKDQNASTVVKIRNDNTGGSAASVLTLDGAGVWQVLSPGSTDTFRFYSGTFGDYVMSMTNTGNVGIGTTSPDSKLHVKGGDLYVAPDSGYTFNNPSSNEDLYVRGNMEVDGTIYGDGSGITNINAGAIQDVWVNESGDTMTGNLNMNNNLIQNIGAAGTDFTSGGGLTLAGDVTVNGGDIDMVKGQTSQIHSLGQISLDWTTGGSYDNPEYHGIQSKDESGNWADDLRINSYSNIINTIDSNSNDANSKFIIQRQSTGNGEDLFTIDENGQTYIKGNVGINTASPSEKLDVNGNIMLSSSNPLINMSGVTIRKVGSNIIISD